MSKNKFRPIDLKSIRLRAEKAINENPAMVPHSFDETRKLVHELQVHQIELEMQNEELRKIYEELENSHDRLAELYDFAPVGYFTISADDVIIEANKKGAAMLRSKVENLIGGRFSFFVADNFKAIYQEYLAGVIRSNSTRNLDLHLVLEDGAPLWAHVEGIAADREDKTSGVTFRDLRISVADTTQLNAEKAARQQSEEQYRRIVETSNEGIWLLDKDYKVAYVNKRIAEMTGSSVEELLGASLEEFTYKEDLDILKEKLERLRGGFEDRFDFRLRRRDGNELWVIVSTNPLLDEAGQFMGALGMLADITGRVKAERSIRETKEKLSLALDGSELGIWDWNIESGMIDYDDRFAKILGYEPGDINPLTAKAWRTTIHPEDLSGFDAAFEAHADGKTPKFLAEVRERTKAGKWIWHSLSGKIIERDGNNRPRHAIGTIHDITSRKAGARQEAKARFIKALLTSESIEECLNLACQALTEAELFRQAVFVWPDSDGAVSHLGQRGLSNKAVERLRRASFPGKSLTRKIIHREFRISKSFFIPADAGIDLSGTALYLDGDSETVSGSKDAWKAGDILLVPCGGLDDNNYIPWLALNTPHDNHRPTRERLEFIEEIIDIAINRARELQLRTELRLEQEQLRAKNIALREVMASIEGEKAEIRKQHSRQITEILIPTVKKMVRKNNTLNKSSFLHLQTTLEEMAESNSLTLPFTYKLSPREIEICALIRNGASSREISNALGIALVTVQKHREVIRRKLRLTNKDINLTTHLRNMQA